MHDIALIFAEAFNAVLPAWVRLPSLTFELPHLIYWPGLILFPLIAAWLVKREMARATKERVTGPIAYMLFFTAGFVGLHRFYLRAPRMGFALVALFLLVLYGNRQGAAARNLKSLASNDLKGADFMVERFQKFLEAGRDGAAEKLAAAQDKLIAVKAKLTDTTAVLEQWEAFAGGLAAAILILLVIDAFKIPVLRRRCLALEADAPPIREFEVMARGPGEDARRSIQTPATRTIDSVNGWIGHYVAYWSVLAVFVYYFEVIARYVFNSPTNWAHEGMFLMFGMQYLLSGAFALREDSHVRVDVLYEKLGERNKARLDIVTSFFFFVFTITLLVTGAIFAMDSIQVWEVSFTEWGIHYWPVKLTISLGAFLLLLQGGARLVRDMTFLARMPKTMGV